MIKNYIFVAFLALFSSYALAQSEITEQPEVEQMPYFPGCGHLANGSPEKRNCSNQSIVKYIANNLEFPPSATTSGIEGTVYAAFEINENGLVSHAFLLKGIDEACEKEALRVIRSMPRWEPAVNDGKPVKVQLHIPIHFYLKDDQFDKSSVYQINWGGLAAKRISAKQLQNNVDKKIRVRNQDGNDLYCTELIFTYERKNTFLQEKSKCTIDDAMAKLVNKVKAGGTFTIVAIVQEKGEFVEVEKTFEIVED